MKILRNFFLCAAFALKVSPGVSLRAALTVALTVTLNLATADGLADIASCKGTRDLHLGAEDNGAIVRVEIANDNRSRSFGLMFRRELGDNCGMLFVFESSRYRTFTMRNTLIPLDIAFIDADGTIKEIFTMQPGGERYPSQVQARYALEMNSGWFAASGIKVGNVIQVQEADDRKPLMSVN